MPNRKHNYFHRQANSVLGVDTEVIGKTDARQTFFPLVEGLKTSPKVIEITDRGQPVAVLLKYSQYLSLISRLANSLKPGVPHDLMGSITIVGDLESGSKEIAESFRLALKESGDKL